MRRSQRRKFLMNMTMRELADTYGKEYLVSERYIHDALVEYAELGLSSLPNTWKKFKRVPAFFIVWPEEAALENAVDARLPTDPDKWPGHMRKAIEKLGAMACMLVEQRENDVRVLFESPYGTCSWTLPIERRGDVTRLGKPKKKKNEDSLGFFWSPRKAEA